MPQSIEVDTERWLNTQRAIGFAQGVLHGLVHRLNSIYDCRELSDEVAVLADRLDEILDG